MGGGIIQVQRMDYEQLYAILPKSHWLWTVQDTREWLNYIGLHSLQTKFEQSSVDGSILDCLSENDLIDQLGISSKIIVKKLMNWIRNGLPAFDKYVEQRSLQLQERSKLQTNKMSVLQRQRTNLKEQPIKEQRIKPREPSLTEQPKRAQANQLIIRNVEQNQTSNYYLKEKGGSIGRQASNQIVIMDQFVSRHHAEIIYERERYYIRDCASSSGTFIKIIQKMELKSGMIIEMGSNQFQISIDAFNNLSVLVIDGPNLEFYKEFKDLQTYSFGRKQSNFVSFPDDQHLSGIHSKIFKLKGKWYIEDIATTNGTWFRLSPEGVQSEPFLLQDKSQFKLSSNLIYECILNTNNRRTHKSAEEKCCYCRLQEKNAMIIPCKHAIGCYECLLIQKECPMCETPITDIVKIFTA